MIFKTNYVYEMKLYNHHQKHTRENLVETDIFVCLENSSSDHINHITISMLNRESKINDSIVSRETQRLFTGQLNKLFTELASIEEFEETHPEYFL